MKMDYLKVLFLFLIFMITACSEATTNKTLEVISNQQKLAANQQKLAANQQKLISKLSDDIGEMADRIVVTEHLIVHVSDSIVNKTPNVNKNK